MIIGEKGFTKQESQAVIELIRNGEKYFRSLSNEITKISSQLINKYQGLNIDTRTGRIKSNGNQQNQKRINLSNLEQVQGELLEMLKFAKLNTEESPFITVRTSEYDDRNNGIDEIVYDKKTGQPLLGIDLTTAQNSKVQERKIYSLTGKIINQCIKVQYGLVMSKTENQIVFQQTEIKNLPVIIFYMNRNEISQYLSKQKTPKDFCQLFIERGIQSLNATIKFIDEKQEQLQRIKGGRQKANALEELKNQYEEALKIFQQKQNEIQS